MKKRLLSFLMIAVMLLAFTGCGGAFPHVEDTFANGVQYGNTLAAEQGEYLAMRGGKDDQPMVFLYHKPTGESYEIAEGEVYQIALLDNTVFYKTLNDECLYAYDLTAKDPEEALTVLLDYALNYQVRDGVVYYLDDEHGTYLKTYDLATGIQGQLNTGYTVDAFWLTDYGMYYCDDNKGALMVLPWGADVDRIVAIQEETIYRDVYAVQGADILYLKVDDNTGEAVICQYKASQNKSTEYLTGTFDNFQYANGQAITVQDNELVAVNIAEGQTYTWGAIDTEYDYLQIMSDCLIFYSDDDNALKATIQYYPESKE